MVNLLTNQKRSKSSNFQQKSLKISQPAVKIVSGKTKFDYSSMQALMSSLKQQKAKSTTRPAKD